MVVYDSAAFYIDSKTTLCDKIKAIDDIVDALMSTALKSAVNDNIEEYWLDDGQTKIKTVYKGTDEIAKSIRALLSIKELYVNQLNGRGFRMVSDKVMRRY